MDSFLCSLLEKEERSVKVAMCVITCPQDVLIVVEDQDAEHMPKQPNSMNSVVEMEVLEIEGLSTEELMEDLTVDLKIKMEDLVVVLGILTVKVIEYATTVNVIVQAMVAALVVMGVALEAMEVDLEAMEAALVVTTMEEAMVEALGEAVAHHVVRKG